MSEYWNHRIMAHAHNGEVYLEMHEVYYTNDIPSSYTMEAISIGGESVKSINWVLNKMKLATKKPILWYGEKFPNEYLESKEN